MATKSELIWSNRIRSATCVYHLLTYKLPVFIICCPINKPLLGFIPQSVWVHSLALVALFPPRYSTKDWLQGAWKIWPFKWLAPPKGTPEVLYLYLSSILTLQLLANLVNRYSTTELVQLSQFSFISFPWLSNPYYCCCCVFLHLPTLFDPWEVTSSFKTGVQSPGNKD